MRLYWEVASADPEAGPVEIPVAFTRFPRDIGGPSRRWAQQRFHQIVSWREANRGGHFAAFEQPSSFIDELRIGLRAIAAASASTP